MTGGGGCERFTVTWLIAERLWLVTCDSCRWAHSSPYKRTATAAGFAHIGHPDRDRLPARTRWPEISPPPDR